MYLPDLRRWTRYTDRFRPDTDRGMLVIHHHVRARMIPSNCNWIPAEEVLPHENCFRRTGHGKDLRAFHGGEHSLLHHPIRRHDVGVNGIAAKGDQHESTTVQWGTNTT